MRFGHFQVGRPTVKLFAVFAADDIALRADGSPAMAASKLPGMSGCVAKSLTSRFIQNGFECSLKDSFDAVAESVNIAKQLAINSAWLANANRTNYWPIDIAA